MPAFGRRTPQRPLVDGRPKRQAVLNRKETLDLTKGISKKDSPKTKEDLPKAKEDPPVKKPAPLNTKNVKDGEKPSPSTSKTKVQPNKSSKTSKSKKPPSSTATRRSARKKTKSEEENESKDTKTDIQEEEKVEEENPNEIQLDDEEKKNNTDSQNDESDESEEESIPDDGELTDEADSDFDPNDDPDKLWCFCKKPHGNRFMICCDTCEEWFHGECVGITMSKGREMEKTGEEWCCRVCKENAAKKQAKHSPVKSALNSPIKKPTATQQKPLDPATLTKARSLSLDSIKNSLGKKMKDRNLTLSTSSATSKEGKDTSAESSKRDSNKPENQGSSTGAASNAQEQSTDNSNSTATKKADNSRSEKRKDTSTDKNSFSNLLTFDHVPMKKEEKTTQRKGSAADRRESVEDPDKKRKDKEIQNKSKVRITPTPKSMEAVKQCHRGECTKPVMKGSIYCSRECIYKYANDSIKYLENERKKNLPVESSKTTSKGTTIISPAQSTTDSVPMETTQERIAVFDKATGKVVAGVMAPTKKYLFAWLEEHPTFEVLKSNKQADVRNPKKNQDEVVRSNVRKSLREVLTSRCKDSQMPINIEAIGKLSKRIENELLKLFGGETGQKYKTKYRSLIFNLKDNNNKILYKRIVSGEINPNKLVNMSPEQLATPELAKWRENESKHGIEMIKKRELEEAEMKKFSGVKKTHKGEVEIEGENENLEILESKIEPVQDVRKASISSDTMVDLLKDTTEEHSHHLFDSNCKICTGKLPPPGESQVTGVSTTVIQAIPESSVPSPTIEDDISLNSPPSPDTSVPLTPTSPITAPPPSVRKQPSVWRGFVMMQKVAKFVCTAYAVSGTCENLMEILPDTIHVCGRIPPNQVWEYLSQLKEGRKESKYIDVIRFEMSAGEEKAGYIKLYTYFYTRQRIGVVGNCYSGVKDMYILPLASHDPIPSELKPLPGLPKPRPHMLVGIIIRVKKGPKKPLSDVIAVDSSPESLSPKKKKKKKKEKEQLDKEKIEIEAQKKLIDIIFKNRSSDLSNIAESAEDSKELDPVSILKSIASTSTASTASTSTSSKDSMEVDFQTASTSTNHTTATAATGSDQENTSTTDGVEGFELKSEDEQMKLLREQQEEIDKLKAKLNIDEDTSLSSSGHMSTYTETSTTTSAAPSGQDTVFIPDPQSMAKTLRETIMAITAKTEEAGDSKNIQDSRNETPMDLIKSPTDGATLPTQSTDCDPLTDNKRNENTMNDIAARTGGGNRGAFVEDGQDIYDASATAEIMREALQRAQQSEQDEANLKAEEQHHGIPLLGRNTSSSLPSSSSRTSSDVTTTSSKISSMLSAANDSKGDIQPSDDEYVMNLIENIKIPNVPSTQSPLEALRNRSSNHKMPGLPAINLPSPTMLPPGIPPPIPGVIPKVPIPPNIKLPPGVPFPPLPPPIPASQTGVVSGMLPNHEMSSTGSWNSTGFNESRNEYGGGNSDVMDPRHRQSYANALPPHINMDPRTHSNMDSRNDDFEPRGGYNSQRPAVNSRLGFVEHRDYSSESGNLDYQNNRNPRNVETSLSSNYNRPMDLPEHRRNSAEFRSPDSRDRRIFSSPPSKVPSIETEDWSLSWRERERRRVDNQQQQHDEGEYPPSTEQQMHRGERWNDHPGPGLSPRRAPHGNVEELLSLHNREHGPGGVYHPAPRNTPQDENIDHYHHQREMRYPPFGGGHLPHPPNCNEHTFPDRPHHPSHGEGPNTFHPPPHNNNNRQDMHPHHQRFEGPNHPGPMPQYTRHSGGPPHSEGLPHTGGLPLQMPPFSSNTHDNQLPPPNPDNRMHPPVSLIQDYNHGVRPDIHPLPPQHQQQNIEQPPHFQNPPLDGGFGLHGPPEQAPFQLRPPGREFQQQQRMPDGNAPPSHHGQFPDAPTAHLDQEFMNQPFQPQRLPDMNMLPRPPFPSQLLQGGQRFPPPQGFGPSIPPNQIQEPVPGGFVEGPSFPQQQQQNMTSENQEQPFNANSNQQPQPLMETEFRPQPRDRKPAWEREKGNNSNNNRDKGFRGNRDDSKHRSSSDMERSRYNDDRRRSQEYTRDRLPPPRDGRRAERKRRYSDTEESNKEWRRNEPYRSSDEQGKSDSSSGGRNNQDGIVDHNSGANFKQQQRQQQQQPRDDLEEGELIEHGGDKHWQNNQTQGSSYNKDKRMLNEGGYKPWKK